MEYHRKFILSALLLYLHFVGTFSISTFTNISREIINNPTLERWMNLDQSLKEKMKSFLNGALPHLLHASEVLNLTSKCKKESLQLISGLRNLDTWAISFLDSTAKPQSGFISGAVSSFGAYKQCLDTVATGKPYKGSRRVLFQGQYCLIDVKPPLPNKTRIIGLNDQLEELTNFSGSDFLSYVARMAHYFHLVPSRLGVCIPSGCSRRDMDQLAQLTAHHLHLSAKISNCEVNEKVQFTETVIFVICTCSFLVLLVLLSSLVEILSYYYKMNLRHKGFQVLFAFSLITNFKKLVNVKTSSESLRCLHGIRALSMFWVVLGHIYIFHSRSVFMF
ncbi:nose resistant to fluoxetine protein 6-like, partial [Stegodyphus dumicola]|uniref:nose resistant to fluoxetine protein 6-like n=1 Tax=Stegodyphus dumicola TaxID=202533 RepID=UPI0015AD6224